MPIVPLGISAIALASMQQKCDVRKKEDDALSLCLPPSLHDHLPVADIRSSCLSAPPQFRIPQWPQPQPARRPTSPRPPSAACGAKMALMCPSQRDSGTCPQFKSHKCTATFFVNKVCPTVVSKPKVKAAVRKCEQKNKQHCGTTTSNSVNITVRTCVSLVSQRCFPTRGPYKTTVGFTRGRKM